MSPTTTRETHHDWERREAVLDQIVRRLSYEAGVDPIDLPPLYEYVDTDALCALLAPEAGSDAEVGVEFRVEDWLVAASSDGAVSVTTWVDPEPDEG